MENLITIICLCDMFRTIYLLHQQPYPINLKHLPKAKIPMKTISTGSKSNFVNLDNFVAQEPFTRHS